MRTSHMLWIGALAIAGACTASTDPGAPEERSRADGKADQLPDGDGYCPEFVTGPYDCLATGVWECEEGTERLEDLERCGCGCVATEPEPEPEPGQPEPEPGQPEPEPEPEPEPGQPDICELAWLDETGTCRSGNDGEAPPECCEGLDGLSPCCDPADDPGGPEGAWCCADGSWVEDAGSNDPFVCDSRGGVGRLCEATQCDDGSEVACDETREERQATCGDDEIAALREGCYECVDPDTCS